MNQLKTWIKRMPEILREWVWLGRYMRRYRLTIVFYICIGILGVAMGLVMSVAQRSLINAVTAEIKIPRKIITAATLAIGLAISQIFIKAVSGWISAHVSIRVVNEIREDIFRKVLASRWELLCRFHSGDLINRLEGDVNAVSSGVITFLPNLVTGLVQFLGAFLIIMAFDPLMAVFALISAPVLVFSARPMMKIMRKHNQRMREVNGRILSFNEEVFQNIQLVKAFSLGSDYCEGLRTLLWEYRRIRLDFTKISIAVSVLMGFLGLIAGYSCYAWSVYRLYTGAILYGDMAMFIQLAATLSSAFSALIRMVPAAVSTATCAGRVMEVTALPAETDIDGEAASALREIADVRGVEIHFRDVAFTYMNGQIPVLQRVSFIAKPGQVVALVGPSGGGKTTVLRLMLGLLSPEQGSLSVVDPVEGISLPVSESTRRLCAYVPQGNSIFSGTIESNLRSVAPDATGEEVVEALRTADAWDFVSELPDTYRTRLGERGLNLSEGQLQRIAIARAVLRNAPILIMDEATSALDADTEARVLRNLMAGNPHRICLVTTHRAGMLAYADLVFRVEGDGSFHRVKAEDMVTAAG
ncbi:MAG: ABC transporter ATP-binding protein [Clostridia bacterium]|nr:ABC transporter ATP-binding protein [Clostridia bacterium]